MSKTNKYQIRKKRRDRKSFEKNRWIRMWREMPLRFHEYAKNFDLPAGQLRRTAIFVDTAAPGTKDYTVVGRIRKDRNSGDGLDALALALAVPEKPAGIMIHRAVLDEKFPMTAVENITEEELTVMHEKMLDKIIRGSTIPPERLGEDPGWDYGDEVEVKRK